MSSIAASADFHGVVPRVNRMMDSVTATRQQLHQLWQIRKLKLEQCLELRLFEQDVQKVELALNIHSLISVFIGCLIICLLFFVNRIGISFSCEMRYCIRISYYDYYCY